MGLSVFANHVWGVAFPEKPTGYEGPWPEEDILAYDRMLSAMDANDLLSAERTVIEVVNELESGMQGELGPKEVRAIVAILSDLKEYPDVGHIERYLPECRVAYAACGITLPDVVEIHVTSGDDDRVGGDDCDTDMVILGYGMMRDPTEALSVPTTFKAQARHHLWVDAS